MIKNETEIENKLFLDWKMTDSIFNPIYTKSHFFIKPLINIENIDLGRHYINTYLDDELKPTNDSNRFLCLFKTTDIENNYSNTWDRLSKFLINNPYQVYHYYIGNNTQYNLMAFVFNIPEEFIPDVQLLINDSSYSKTSREYKMKIISLSRTENTKSLMKSIFFKYNSLRKEIEKRISSNIDENQEYWDTFYSTREIFRFNIK